MPKAAPQLRIYFGDKVYRAGFLAVPHLLNRHYRRLGLDEGSYVFLLQLLSIELDLGEPPRNLPDIARRMDRDLATVRRHSHKLNTLGLVIIREAWEHNRRVGNDYDLSPLWDRLTSFAEEDEPISVGRVVGPVVRPEQSADTSNSDTDARVEHLFTRANLRGSNPITNARVSHAPMQGTPAHERGVLKEESDDLRRSSDEDTAAATTLGQIISLTDARELIATYPACIPHAAALVAEARNGTKPSGLLVSLIKRGWTPPTGAAPTPTPVSIEPLHQELWREVTANLRMDLDASDYTTWIAPTHLLDIDHQNAVAVIGTPNVFVRDEVRARFATQIAAVLTTFSGQTFTVDIVIGGS